jgi:glycosyltransferase involved in cell wall biosynthesis
MNFDVIIATFNRKKSLNTLVRQILSCSQLPENIIIIDSSKIINEEVQNFDRVKYVHSNHTNQPYQRYIGHIESSNDILVYFDDDMRILDKQCFTKILSIYENIGVVGVQPNFTYKNEFFDIKIPKSKIKKLSKKFHFYNFLKILSGNPKINDGKFWFSGLRGLKPRDGGTIEWFNGPVFSVKKQFLYKNFNFNLFDLYEKRLGKAEDAILGFTASRLGKIIYIEDKMFFHEDNNDSVYSADLISFGSRVAFSRLYLSFEYARLSKKSLTLAFMHFNLYIFWRIIGMMINQLISYERDRNQLIYGYLKGYLRALMSIKKLISFEDQSNLS